jgi:hypothetical protein
MLRAFSIFGMGVGFLLISPGLRGTVVDGITLAAAGLARYSPYSYAGVAVALLLGLMVAFSSASAAR